MKKQKISFSETLTHFECPWKRKLMYDDRVPSDKSIHLSFGTVMHEFTEFCLKGTPFALEDFKARFEKENVKTEVVLTEKEFNDASNDGYLILQEVKAAFDKYFKDGYEVLAVELPLYENIGEEEDCTKFKGFVDLILKDGNGKIHILDFKTCQGYYWDARKRSDKMTNYQLVFYKKFYADKMGLKPEDIELHFCLLKKKEKEGKRVELFKITSGKVKIKNAMLLLEKTIKQIETGKPIKNRLNCDKCRFRKTKYCP